MVVGFKGKAGAGGLYALPYGDMVIVWRELCPCLNPLGLTGKRPVGPERSVAALRPFNRAPGMGSNLAVKVRYTPGSRKC